MIINTGSRTDIPAYYSQWFYQRISEGYVLVRNPYYPQQVLHYRLSPDVVDMLVFCSKNPIPMLNRINELADFRQFWFVTITPYGRDIEPNVPSKHKIIEALIKLSEITGIRSVSWRYDPIFINERYTVDYHIKAFEAMAKILSGYVDHCVISFIDLYEKTKRNFPGVHEVTREEQHEIGRRFAEIGRKYGILIRTCCEGTELEKYGVDVSGCMTKEVFERAMGYILEVPAGRQAAREGCRCLLGNDIGMYNTCGHACVYCYANYDRKTVLENMRRHDPKSPFLIGGHQEGDIIREVDQKLYCSGQLKLIF